MKRACVQALPMAGQSREIAMLAILHSTCETALQASRAADNPIDHDLVNDLERMVERTGQELKVLTSG